MKDKHYIVCIRLYEEEEPDYTDKDPRLFYASSMEQAKERLEKEFYKTISYAKAHHVDTNKDNDDFSTWMSEEKDQYEVQAEGLFYEKGKIYETEEA